ncbi:hypothetical protein AAF712_010535 [Marasmius tenuissimus]|uniref:Nucleotidyltransferase family protein n=1 Tax=Marasmius tenuissimus TaxID=585030 RepID=A0ABR2ZLN8_9AGAR
MPYLQRHDIDEAIVAAAGTLHKCGYRHCLFGSAACYLYLRLARQPIPRTPNDVDIVVFPDRDVSIDAEDIKHNMTIQDPRFFLTESKKPGATYKVLWFRPQGRPRVGVNYFEACKIDMLVDEDAKNPSSLEIPYVPSDLLKICHVKLYQNGSTIVQAKERSPAPEGVRVCIMPSLMLLFLKIKGWEDHGNSEEERFRKKVPNDVLEILLLTQHVVFTSSFGIELDQLELK